MWMRDMADHQVRTAGSASGRDAVQTSQDLAQQRDPHQDRWPSWDGGVKPVTPPRRACPACDRELPPPKPTGRPRMFCDAVCRNARLEILAAVGIEDDPRIVSPDWVPTGSGSQLRAPKTAVR